MIHAKKGPSATNATKNKRARKPTQTAPIPLTSGPAAQRPALEEVTAAVNNVNTNSIDELRGTY
jgi:hypothetical protein